MEILLPKRTSSVIMWKSVSDEEFNYLSIIICWHVFCNKQQQSAIKIRIIKIPRWTRNGFCGDGGARDPLTILFPGRNFHLLRGHELNWSPCRRESWLYRPHRDFCPRQDISLPQIKCPELKSVCWVKLADDKIAGKWLFDDKKSQISSYCSAAASELPPFSFKAFSIYRNY